MADDLHRLLTGADIAPPYVLAGHSLGGVIARRFIRRYPGSVCGLVLIDSSHEDQARRLGRAGPPSDVKRAVYRRCWILGARRLAAALGWIPSLDTDAARESPPEFAAAAKAMALSTRHRNAVVRELFILSRSQGQPPGLGSLPLTVLSSANRSWAGWPIWEQMQAELAQLSSDSSHVAAVKAGHYINLDEPDLVVAVIRDIVRRYRTAA